MSTGPGPTHKADGSSDVDDIAELLVEDESATREAHPQVDQALDDSLVVMLETPGPAVLGTFMPPPPLLPNAADENSSETEDRENAEEGVGQSNLAYEDLLAKLVLPSENAAVSESSLPAPESSLSGSEPLLSSPPPEPEASAAPAALTPVPLPVFTPPPAPAPISFDRPSSSLSLATSATDERTLVTENPLLAKEQEAAAREGRSATRDQVPRVQEDYGSVASGPVTPLVAANVATKTKMGFFLAGNLAMLLCMVVAVLVFKIFIQSPASPPAVIMPAAAPLPQPSPPAKVEPLPSPPPAAAVVPVAVPAPSPEPAAEPPAENPSATAQPAPVEAAKVATAPKAHKPSVHKTASHAAPKLAATAPAAQPAPAAKPAAAAKAVQTPVVKPTKAAAPAKKGKAGGYADPFDN